MALKQEQHFFRGIQRDLSVSKFNPEYAFDAQNIRITARDNNTLLTVTNERGNKEVVLKSPSGEAISLDGILVGYNVLNNFVTLFTKGGKDNIYRLENKGSHFETIPLFSGNLNFNTDHPIESLGVYENDSIQKVYWLDGINQSRVINIVATEAVKAKWTNNSFDFVQGLHLKEQVSVSRNDLANGVFSAGVIQYSFTYYNQYGQESNIFYTTPLQYISFVSRGGSPEDKISNSFVISISNIDTQFDYLRIYSIHRTSIDATPTVLNVVDLPIDNNTTSLSYIDNGTTGTLVDPTELLYIGGEEVVFKTMAQKDNTLFLGNAKIRRAPISLSVRNQLKGGRVFYTSRYVMDSYTKPSGFYPYKNMLSLGSEIKSFKYLEWYRFGLQFQHRSGKWSEPVWVNDEYNGPTGPEDPKEAIAPSYDGGLTVVRASHELANKVIKEVVSDGYVKVRGVVVYPTITDREVIAQGMLCPTVFNVGDRFSNSPFSQSSWFSRPNLAFDIEHNKSNYNGFDADITNYIESKGGVISNDNKNLIVQGSSTKVNLDIVNKGAWAEFRHHYPIPDNWVRGAEIQCLANVLKTPFTTLSGSELNSYVSGNSENFFIDQSILTFHSPDIEFDEDIQNIDASNLKLRIVGMIPITSSASDIDIQTSTPVNDPSKIGVYKEFVGMENKSRQGIKSLISGAYWFDKMTNMQHVDDDGGYSEAFFVYAWHRNGSLNNAGPGVIDENGVASTRSAMLDKKKISNLKFSSFTYFLQRPWKALRTGTDSSDTEEYDDGNHTGITPVSIFNSNEQTLLRIPPPKNSNLGDINYYGNVDKVLSASRIDSPYQVEVYFDINGVPTPKTENLNKKDGYPIVVTGLNDASSYAHQLFVGKPFPIQFLKRSDGAMLTTVPNGTDAVRIKYKSTPHAVFALNYTKSGHQVILPTLLESVYAGDSWPVNPIQYGLPIPDYHFFWNPRAKVIKPNGVNVSDRIYQDVFETSAINPNNYGFLYLAELYNDEVSNRFGGKTEEAFESNIWLPSGEPTSLILGYDSNDNPIPVTNSVTVMYTEGDTYLERYDCLKTYPYTLEDQNSVTEIVSFMCETRVNIDGRYDRNRGQISNLITTPTNFNKINPVYSQKNNFFNYRGLNHNRFSLDYFPNTITWTKEKQLGSVIDAWTNITMASTLDLDGDKGEVVSLNTFKNEIFAFQKMGLSNILFNSRVQIPTSDGMPIEITNGLKVGGKRYISNVIGCSNKWSIVESPLGLYFIDNETNSLYLFNGEIVSLSDKLGFRQWISSHNVKVDWEPVGYNNYRSFYDKNNNDVYFTYKDHCLCYSELIGQFTSFMSYERVPAMFNISSDFYAFKEGKIWEQFTGDYNMFFGEYKPFGITFIANAEEPSDKIFNTVEFRADSWEGDTLISNKTFDTLNVWNEYQQGTTTLNDLLGHPSPLKRKFRVWRANIPRDSVNNRDRIRNTWAYIQLKMNTPNTYRTEFHDAIIHYFS